MSSILGRLESGAKPIDPAGFMTAFNNAPHGYAERSDHWLTAHVGVARHLLAISPASGADHGLSPDQGLLLVADAVLDNREELCAELQTPRCELARLSDSALLRLAFLRWGEACVDKLVGDFAFAVVNPDSREAWLFRDHIGARPLYWAQRGESFVFASAIHSLVAFDEWRWRIDERVIAEYLLCPLMPVSKPFFSDINAVPAGGFVRLTQGRIHQGVWWRPSAAPIAKFGGDQEALGACAAVLERAVSDRVATNAPVGAHFSGGVDSTGIAALAARALGARGRTLTRGYAWSPPISDRYPADHVRDERKLISDAAAACNIPVQFGVADADAFLALLERPMELEGDADLADELPVLRAASADGVRVMLSGWGGDEAFSAHGFGYLTHLLLSGAFTRAKAFAHAEIPTLRDPRALLDVLWRQVIPPLLPATAHRLLSPYRSYIRHGSFIAAPLRARHRALAAIRHPGIKFGPDPNQNLMIHLNTGHLTMRMQTWAAWSAPHGFQYRYPLTDRRLLEFLLTLAPQHLFMNDEPRGLARALVQTLTPSSWVKSDIANERLRTDSRFDAWRALAARVASGAYSDDCPWLDVNAFRSAALEPGDQTHPQNILRFAELAAAARVWQVYRRARARGWA